MIFIHILFLLGISIGAAQDLRGTWRGRVFQGEDGEFLCELKISAQIESDFVGTAYCKSVKGPYPGRVKYNTILKRYGKGYDYKDLEVIQEEKTGTFFWCMKAGYLDLSIDSAKQTMTLSGKWDAPGCESGTLSISKSLEAPPEVLEAPALLVENRLVETQHEFVVKSDTVRIECWDNNEEDGDIISLNVDGKWLLRDHLLTREKVEFLIPLRGDGVLLVLHAENLGSIPPNTAAISVYDGQSFRTVTLQSNQTKSEGIWIGR